MPPKKAPIAKKDPEHPSYKDMITAAITTVTPLPSTPPCFESHFGSVSSVGAVYLALSSVKL